MIRGDDGIRRLEGNGEVVVAYFKIRLRMEELSKPAKKT
jgi:hypothetical protein